MDAGLCEANDSPLEADVWSIAAAAISGAQYAVKIRLPHAFVMVFMFRRDLSLQAKLTLCAKAVVEHATSLGGFAALYKAVLVALKLWDRRKLSPSTSSLLYELGRLFVNLFVPRQHQSQCTPSAATTSTDIASLPGRPAQPYHALIAGAVGGYLIWGRWSTLSHQVLMYVSIRVLAALWKLLPVHDAENWRRTHRLAATVAWAAVLYVWETHPDVLQGSLRKSMDEIYDSGLFGTGGGTTARASDGVGRGKSGIPR